MDSPRPDARHKVCPMCNGAGILDRTPHDTVKMTREEFDDLIHETLPTPVPPNENEFTQLPQDPAETLASEMWMEKRIMRIQRENAYFLWSVLFVVSAIVTAIVVVTQ